MLSDLKGRGGQEKENDMEEGSKMGKKISCSHCLEMQFHFHAKCSLHPALALEI
jgi:hypothetical protein